MKGGFAHTFFDIITTSRNILVYKMNIYYNKKQGGKGVNFPRNRGFTVLEILVVLAIIAIISAIGIVRYSSIQEGSRDVRRLSDVSQIKRALSLYQIDNNTFPIHTEPIEITGNDVFSAALEGSGAITDVPTDPLGGFSYTYRSNSAGSDYDLNFCLETDSIYNYSEGCNNTVGP